MRCAALLQSVGIVYSSFGTVVFHLYVHSLICSDVGSTAVPDFHLYVQVWAAKPPADFALICCGLAQNRGKIEQMRAKRANFFEVSLKCAFSLIRSHTYMFRFGALQSTFRYYK